MTLNVPQSSEEDSKSKQWVRDRSRNQQMILDLYKGGGGIMKTDPKESSISQLEIEFVPPPDVGLETAVEGNESSFSRGFGKLLQTFAAFGAGTGSQDPIMPKESMLRGGLPRECSFKSMHFDVGSLNFDDDF